MYTSRLLSHFLHSSRLFGVAAIMIGCSGLIAKADTTGATPVNTIASQSLERFHPSDTQSDRAINSESNFAIAPIQVATAMVNAPATEPLPGKVATSVSALKVGAERMPSSAIAQSNGTYQTPTTPSTTPSDQTTPGTTTPGTTTPDTTSPTQTYPSTPAPGTTTPSETPGTPPSDTVPNTTTPDTTVSPGRATRSGSSYFGVGGNIGIGSGDTALGSGSFAIISKIGLTRELSVRPGLLIEDSVTILLPVTLDFPFNVGPTEGVGFRVAPYVGIGPAISTGDGASVDLLLTGGLDIPLGTQFTLNAAVNATVTGNPAVGVLVGVGYNFRGF